MFHYHHFLKLSELQIVYPQEILLPAFRLASQIQRS
jgi:hypothetical protein